MKKSLMMLSASILVFWMGGCTPTQKVKVDMVEHDQGNPEVITIPEPGVEVVMMPETGSEIEEVDILMQRVQTIHFAYNSYELDDSNYAKALENSAIIKKLLSMSHHRVLIQGHCDEWGGDEYNHALGLERAKAVMDVMLEEGIDREMLSFVSFGELRRVCSERSSACDARNRRVEFRLMPSEER